MSGLDEARTDLDELVGKLSQEVHEAEQAGIHAGPSYLAIMKRYGPSVLEAVLIGVCKLAGVPIPAPI